jgi:acyl dehydratase
MADEHAGYGWWTHAFREAATAWSRSLTLALDAATGANRAMAAFAGGDGAAAAAAAVPSVSYDRPDWSFERSADAPADLGVGDYVRFTKRVTDADVREFADATGDTNRLHLDDAYARRTRFGGRVAHGVLVAGLVSAALARLPGTVVYLSQDLEFLRPVEVGETVTADCEIVEALGGDRYRVATTVRNEAGETVLDGDATVLVDEVPDGTPT